MPAFNAIRSMRVSPKRIQNALDLQTRSSRFQWQICDACKLRLQTRHASSTPDQESSSNLPSHSEQRRTKLSKRVSHVMDNLQTNLFTASQRLNDLTGYTGIEALKRSIADQETRLLAARKAVQSAKDAYSTAIATRSASQREVNNLLQRRSSWTPVEVERFTELYRSDHENEQTEESAQQRLVEVEREAEEIAARLSRDILARYHEEQIWSDKIRRMSTWGTWGLMGVNVLLFLVFQVLVEPWRRKRLVEGFDDKVKEALNLQLVGKNDSTGGSADSPPGSPNLTTETENGISTGIELATEDASLEQNSQLPLIQWSRRAIDDLFSSRNVTLRKADHTVSILESAAAGAAVAGILFTIALRRN